MKSITQFRNKIRRLINKNDINNIKYLLRTGYAGIFIRGDTLTIDGIFIDFNKRAIRKPALLLWILIWIKTKI
jgi:hypothetical protein